METFLEHVNAYDVGMDAYMVSVNIGSYLKSFDGDARWLTGGEQHELSLKIQLYGGRMFAAACSPILVITLVTDSKPSPVLSENEFE